MLVRVKNVIYCKKEPISAKVGGSSPKKLGLHPIVRLELRQINFCKTFTYSLVKTALLIFLLLAASISLSAQTARTLLGIKLRPEIAALADEIEKKTGKKIYAEFTGLEEYMIASSFINEEDGRPIVLVSPGLEGDVEKLPAVLAHELLHLRLRVNNFPTFLFSPDVKTSRGRAIDVEQGNINDLKDLIEHRVFRAEMEKFGVYDALDIAGDTAKNAAARKGRPEGNSDAVNYARAILEYHDPKDLKRVTDLFTANGWKRSLKVGSEMAGMIDNSVIKAPADDEAVFSRCLSKLYPPPAGYTFQLTPDPANKYFRQMIISINKRSVRKTGK